MRGTGRIIAIALLGVLAPSGIASAAPAPKSMSVTLHAAGKVKGRMAFAHVMASARLRYTKHDVFITLTTDNLPKPSTLGERAYVLFASNGGMTERVGALRANGAMSGVSGQVMMTRVQDLYVYAVGSPTAMHPMGVEVLAAMVP